MRCWLCKSSSISSIHIHNGKQASSFTDLIWVFFFTKHAKCQQPSSPTSSKSQSISNNRKIWGGKPTFECAHALKCQHGYSKPLTWKQEEKHQCWSGSDQCCAHFEFCKEPYVTNWCSHIISPATTKPTHDRIKLSCNTITFTQNTMSSSPTIIMSKPLASCHCSSLTDCIK